MSNTRETVQAADKAMTTIRDFWGDYRTRIFGLGAGLGTFVPAAAVIVTHGTWYLDVPLLVGTATFSLATALGVSGEATWDGIKIGAALGCAMGGTLAAFSGAMNDTVDPSSVSRFVTDSLHNACWVPGQKITINVTGKDYVIAALGDDPHRLMEKPIDATGKVTSMASHTGVVGEFAISFDYHSFWSGKLERGTDTVFTASGDADRDCLSLGAIKRQFRPLEP